MVSEPIVNRALRRPFQLLAAACAIAAAAFSVGAATLEDYHARVDTAIEIVSEYESTEDYSAPIPLASDLEPLRGLLPTTETVEFDGTSVLVDNTWLARELDRYAVMESLDDRIDAVARLSALLYDIDQQILQLETEPRHATAADRQQLRDILERSEFRESGENPVSKFLRETRDKLLEWLAELLRPIFSGPSNGGMGYVMRIVIFAVGGLALALLARAIWQAIGRRRTAAVRGKKVIFGEEIDETTTANDLADQARRLAAGGDYRGAIRRLFVALIYQLDERELVRLCPNATNREYLALVRKYDRLHPVMASLADTFELVWYGEMAVDRVAYDSFEKMHTQATRIVSNTAAPASV